MERQFRCRLFILRVDFVLFANSILMDRCASIGLESPPDIVTFGTAFDDTSSLIRLVPEKGCITWTVHHRRTSMMFNTACHPLHTRMLHHSSVYCLKPQLMLTTFLQGKRRKLQDTTIRTSSK